MINNDQKAISRKIPLSEYYSVLQKEYVVAELRSIIYPNEKDKAYYKEREMKGKKVNIEDIAFRNNLASIFNSPERLDFYRNMIYGNGIGLPNFIYRNDEDRENRRKKDVLFYFNPGINVEVIEQGENSLFGTVVYCHVDRSVCTVNISGEEKEINFSKLKRIFSEGELM